MRMIDTTPLWSGQFQTRSFSLQSAVQLPNRDP